MKRRTQLALHSAIALAIAGILPSTASFAQDSEAPAEESGAQVQESNTLELEEVVVTARKREENLQEIPRIIRRAPKVVIAAVRGYAVGAGFEISIDSDMIVAAKDAVFGFPESNAGMTITGGATKLLPMIVGLNKARELMLTGEFIDADEAYRIGLVNKLVPVGEEEKEAERLARVVMSRAPMAVIHHKRMVTQSTEADFETALNLEKQTIATLVYSEDYGEAVQAFSEKRKPKFKGR